jgi:predicted PurR-regulated permease PerM
MSEIRILTPDNPTGETSRTAHILTPDHLIVEYTPQWAPWVRQFVAIALVLGLVAGIILLGPIAQILIGSFLLALVMYFPARFITKRMRVGYKSAVGFLYLFLILCLCGAAALLIPIISDGVQSFSNAAEQQINAASKFFEEYSAATPEKGIVTILGAPVDLNPFLLVIDDLIGRANGQQPVPATPAASATTTSALQGINLQGILNLLTGIVGSILGFTTSLISTLLLSLFISFLILIELPDYQRGLFKLIPPVHHREMSLLANRLVVVWRGFFRGQLIVGLIIGALTWLQCTLMGVQGAVPLAILTAVVSLIPNIGGIIALIPLAIVPLIQGSTVFTTMPNSTFAFLVVGINLVISQIIWNVVAPSIIGDALSLPLPVIIVGVFFGAAIGGIVGAFLIAPILGSLKVLTFYLLMKIGKQDPFPGEQWVNEGIA